jgi:hypothetical protein
MGREAGIPGRLQPAEGEWRWRVEAGINEQHTLAAAQVKRMFHLELEIGQAFDFTPFGMLCGEDFKAFEKQRAEGVVATAGIAPAKNERRRSGIRYVSPAQRHAGEDQAILAARHAVYLRAKEQNPARWSGTTRNWTPVGPVTLNPERDSVIKTHLAGRDNQVSAA